MRGAVRAMCLVLLGVTGSAQSALPLFVGPLHRVTNGLSGNDVLGILGAPAGTVTFLGVDEWHFCESRRPERVVVVYLDSDRVLGKLDYSGTWNRLRCLDGVTAGGGLRYDGQVPAPVRALWATRAPRVILFTGGLEARAIALDAWNDNMRIFGAVAAPVDVAVDALQGRSYFEVALFWGDQWSRYSATRPRQAQQHGRFYPAVADLPALFVFADENTRRGATARDVGLVRAVDQAGLQLLREAGVPVRIDGAGLTRTAPISEAEIMPIVSRVDHLVYATPDLQAGIDRIEALLGIRASPGGQHPGLGTRNALVSLGPTAYLEIIGPDPEQTTFQSPRPFGIDELTGPALTTWAANAPDLDQLARLDLGGGVRLGEVASGSRRTPQGLLLSWRFTNPRVVVADGIVPFLINWGDTPHPATTAAQGAVLTGLRAEHPDAGRVVAMLQKLGLDLDVSAGPAATLVATVAGRRGLVELR